VVDKPLWDKRDLPQKIGQRAENPAFQIRSSYAQFSRFLCLERLEKSISYVFSIPLNIPTSRLQGSNGCVINGLHRMPDVQIPDASGASDSSLPIEDLQGIRSTSSAIMPVSSTRVSAF
jgi:hypothetical protein